MMTFDDAKAVSDKMDKLEWRAVYRCAQYQMQYEDLEEIGSSDISCHAIEMIRSGGWPADLGEVPVGFLVDEYCEALRLDPSLSPIDVHSRILRTGIHKRCLPPFAYEGKHSLSKEAADKFNAMRELLAPVDN